MWGGFVQSGSSSNPQFSNVNSNDMVMRTTRTTDKLVFGSGLNAASNASMYVVQSAVGINTVPDADTMLDVGGVFKVGKDSNVYVSNELRAQTAYLSNLTVGTISYTDASASDLAASNLLATSATVASNLTVGGGIYPTSNNSTTLGNSNNRFSDLWLAGRSFHIGETTMSQSSNGDLMITDNAETVLKDMIAAGVQVGGFSNNLRITQGPEGGFAVYHLNLDGTETRINLVENLTVIGSNVGIGVASPSQVLDVGGNALVRGDLLLSGGLVLSEDSNSSTLYINSNHAFDSVNIRGTHTVIENRLGISKADPLYPLDVTGIARLNNILLIENQLPFLSYNDYVDPDQNIPWYGISVPSATSNLHITGKQGIRLMASNAPIVIDQNTSGLGIFTSNVNAMLQFADQDDLRKIVFKERGNNPYEVMSMGTTQNALVLQVPSSNDQFVFQSAVDSTVSKMLLSISGDGRVKVGEGAPALDSKLDVDGTVKTSGMLIVGDSQDTFTDGRLFSAGKSSLVQGQSVSLAFGQSACNQAELVYAYSGESGECNVFSLGHPGASVVSITSKGNVGISSSAPREALDVIGNVAVSGNTHVEGAIFASSIAGACNFQLDVGTDSNTHTVNIGGSNTIVNIGGYGDTVNIMGALTFIDSVNTVIADRALTLNHGGPPGSAAGCGIMFEEGSNEVGYMTVNSTDDGFVFKAPLASNTLAISLLSNVAINNAVFISSTASNSMVGFGTATDPQYSVHVQNTQSPVLCVETLAQDAAKIALANSAASWMFQGPVAGSNNALQLVYSSNAGVWAPKMTVQNNGYVGIGTDSPQYALDVSGTINADNILVNGLAISAGGGGTVGGSTATGWDSTSSNIFTDCNVGIKTHVPRYELDVSGTVNAQRFFLDGAPFTAGYWTVGDGFMTSTSNVGINVMVPAYALDVGGTINASNILVNGTSIASGFWQLNGGNVFSLSNVGVGTSIPNKKLDVVGDARVTGNLEVTQTVSAGSLTVSGASIMSGGATVDGPQVMVSHEWGDGIIFNNGQNRMYADTESSSVVLNIDAASNLNISTARSPAVFVSGSTRFVGIANSNPACELDVNGTISASNYLNVPWSGIVGVPAFCNVAVSASYLDLSNRPQLASVATTGQFDDLSNRPSLCNVATSGSYLDLDHTPAIATAGLTGDYADLTNRPVLCNLATTGSWADVRDVPANLSQLAANDLSNFSAQTVVFNHAVGIANDDPSCALDVTGAIKATSYCNVNYADLTNKPALCNVALTGKMTDLTDTQPLSYFTNDLSYFGHNIGIGVDVPSYPLHVSGAVYASSYCNLDWSMVNNVPSFARPSYSNLEDAPVSLSQFSNDLSQFSCNASFGASVSVSGSVTAAAYCNVSYANLTDRPSLCNLALTGSWSDVLNKPSLGGLQNDLTYFGCNIGIQIQDPVYPLQVNGAVYATTYCNVAWEMIQDKPAFCNVATTGRYADLTNAPSLLSQFTNDLSNFTAVTTSTLVASTVSAQTYCNLDWSMVNNKPNYTNNYNLLCNLPALQPVALSGAYADLMGSPALCNVATTGAYASLTGTPELSVVAYSGSNSYANLTGTPSLCNLATTSLYADVSGAPTSLSQLSNDLTAFPHGVSFASIDTTTITAQTYCNLSWSMIPDAPPYIENYNLLTNRPSLCNVATSGRYSDVSGTPALCNLALSADYTDLAGAPVLSVIAYEGSNSYANLTERPALCNVALTANYLDLANTPSNLGAFANDLTSLGNVAFDPYTGTMMALSYCNIDWSMVNNTPAFTTDYRQLLHTPALCNLATTAAYTDLVGTPSLCNVAISASYADLVGTPALSVFAYEGSNSYSNLIHTPSLCNVALSGSYADLEDTPSNLSEFNNDLTSFGLISFNPTIGEFSALSYKNIEYGMIKNVPEQITSYYQLQNTPTFCNVASTGSYLDLSGAPALCNVATVGTYQSLLNTPDLGPLAYASSNSYFNLNDTPALCNVALSGAYANLSGTPSNLSQFTNDLTYDGLLVSGDAIVQGTVSACNVVVSGTMKAGVVTAKDTDTALEIGCTSNVTLINIGNNTSVGHLINIGTTSAPGMSNVISIGGPTDTVHIPGQLTYVYQNITRTSNHTITLNEGGQVGSSSGAGIFIEEGGASDTYIQVSGDRSSFLFRTPTSTADTTMDMSGNQLTLNGALTANAATSNVGVGTKTPSEKLQVLDGHVRIDRSTASNGLSNALVLGYLNSPSNAVKIDSVYRGSNRVDLRLFSCSNGQQIETATLANGFLGIGTSEPSVSVHAAGDVSLNKVLYYRNETAATNSNGTVKLIDVPAMGTVNYHVPSSYSADPVVTMVPGRVGIGTTNPQQSLEVAGNIATQGITSSRGYSVTATTDTDDGAPVFGLGLNSSNSVKLTSGNTVEIKAQSAFLNTSMGVGIGKTDPQQSLDVVGNIAATSNIISPYMNTNTLSASNIVCPSLTSLSNTLSAVQLTAANASNVANSNLWQRNTSNLVMYALGSVGIGQTNPSYPLDVAGAINATSYCNVTWSMVQNKPSLATIAYAGSNTYANLTGTPALCNIATTASWSNLANVPNFAAVAFSGAYSNLSGLPASLVSFSNTLTTFPNSIGIKRTNPAYEVDVNGTVNASNYLVNGAPLSSIIPPPGFWNSTTSAEYTMSNVGIGTTVPVYPLDVNGAIRAVSYCNLTYAMVGSAPSFVYASSNTYSNLLDRPAFCNVATTAAWADINGKPTFASIALSGAYSNLVGAPTTLSSFTNDLTSFPERVTFCNGVGINKSNPAYALDVSGTINASNFLVNGNPISSIVPLSGFWQNNTNNEFTMSNVGIGTQYPGVSLDVVGAVRATSFCNLTYAMVSGTPSLSATAYAGSNTYSNLIDRPSFCNVALTASWSDLAGVPAFADVALSGSYSNLVNAPSALTSFSNDLTNFPNQVTFCNSVGINKSNPSYSLDVVGTVNASNFLVNGNPISTLVPVVGYWLFNSNGEYTNSNVGIKTTTPAYPLDVAGTIRATSYCNITYSMVSGTPNLSVMAHSGSNTYGNLLNAPAFCNIATTGSWADLNGVPAFAPVATSGQYADLQGKPTTLSNFTNNLTSFQNQITFCNNIGIKKASPAYAIDVDGTVNASNFLVNGNPISSLVPPSGYWQNTTAYQYCMSNVGVGTSTPQAALQVANDLSISACNAPWNYTPGKGLYLRYSTYSNQDSAYICSVDQTTGRNYDLAIQASNVIIGRASITNPSPVYVRFDGRVGVGTSNPSQALDVNGYVNATGYCNVSYCNLTNLPVFATVARTGNYADLVGTPAFASVALSGSYNELSNKPTYARVATTAAYADLSNAPAVLSAFGNDLNSFSKQITFSSNVIFANSNTNRTIVMYDAVTPNNSNQFSGFGISNGSLRYQVADQSTDHAFFAGTSSNVSAEVMRIKGTGGVGIGTSSPAQKLHVSGGSLLVDGTQSPSLYLVSTGSNTLNSAGEVQFLQQNQQNGWKLRYASNSNALNFVQLSNSAETSVFFVSSNVGIKNSAPRYDLDVNGVINAASYCNITWSIVSGKPSFSAMAYSGSNTWANLTGMPTQLSYFANDLTSFGCNAYFACNVGIGVATPTCRLDVSGGVVKCATMSLSSSNLALQSITSGGSLSVGSDSNTTSLALATGTSVSAINIGNGSTSVAAINVGNANSTVSVSGSNISIGSSSATLLSTQAKVAILNSAGPLNSAGSCGFQFYENSNATSYLMTSADRSSFLLKTPLGTEMSLDLMNNGVNINNKLYLTGEGSVGIGTNSPTQSLEVAGNIKCLAVLTTSDARLKENITHIPNSLEKLKTIQGVYFNWKDERHDSKRTHAGVLAQDVEHALPEAVHDGASGMGVDYNAVLALCINAIKEQQVVIEDLKRRITK
jgi:Chaperone of endosialidase